MCDPTKFTARYGHVFTELLGMRAWVDEHDDILVQINEDLALCVINTAPRDPEMLRMFAVLSTGVSRADLDAACAVVNGRVVGAKLFTVGTDKFVAEAQMVVAGRDCLPTPEHLAAVLPRVISALQFALAELGTELTLHGIAEATESAA